MQKSSSIEPIACFFVINHEQYDLLSGVTDTPRRRNQYEFVQPIELGLHRTAW